MLKNHNGLVVGKMPDGAIYFEQCYWPYLETDDLARLAEALEETIWVAVKSPPGPLVSGADGDNVLREGARRFAPRTDRAIIGLFGGNLLEVGQFLYRIDNFLMLLAGDPDGPISFSIAWWKRIWRIWSSFLAAVGEHIDIILFGDDLGMQNGPQMSPAMYEEFFKPRHARMWRRAKELADVKVMLHCCGGVQPLLRHLIEAGLDAINPVQISCAGMDARGLKQEFGAAMTFWGGGCDTHRILSQGTPDRGPRTRAPANRDPEAGRRLRLSTGPQHPG